jgi:hypothetical protein
MLIKKCWRVCVERIRGARRQFYAGTLERESNSTILGKIITPMPVTPGLISVWTKCFLWAFLKFYSEIKYDQNNMYEFFRFFFNIY